MDFCEPTSSSATTVLPPASHEPQPRKAKATGGKRRNTKIFVRNFFSVDIFTLDTRYYFLTNPLRACNDSALNHLWNKPIFCSEETAKILSCITTHDHNRGVKAEFIQPLKTGERITIEPNLYVTLVKSHYCPGSVMFLFEGSTVPGYSMLCTGPFRADLNFLSYLDISPVGKMLQDTAIGTVFLDNKNIDTEELPSKWETARRLVNIICENPQLNIVFLLDPVGHENMLEEIARHTGENIVVYKKRLFVFELLKPICGFPDMYEQYDPDITRRIRTITVQKRNARPDSWNVSEPFLVIDLYEDSSRESGNNYLHLPLFSHSSGSEMKEFIKRLKFSHLIPTGKDLLCSTEEELQALARPLSSVSTPGNMHRLVRQVRNLPCVKFECVSDDISSMYGETTSEADHKDIDEKLVEENKDSSWLLERQMRILDVLLQPKEYKFMLGNQDLSAFAPPIRLTDSTTNRRKVSVVMDFE